MTSVNQNDRQVGGRSAGRHVAGILLVAGGIGDDELALLGREKAISEIDGDLLFALGRKSVEQQREVEVFHRVGQLAGILTQRLDLIVEHQLGLEQQPAEQARLAVIDRTAGDEAQQALALVIVDYGVARYGGRVGKSAHVHVHQK